MQTRDDFTFFHPFRIRYSEIDAQGVVFNAHYLTFFDTAVTEFMRQLDYDYSLTAVQETGQDFHTVRTIVDYHAPIFFDEQIEVGVKAGRIGNSSLTWALAIFGPDEAAPRATGEIVWVSVNLQAHKSIPLPEKLVTQLS